MGAEYRISQNDYVSALKLFSRTTPGLWAMIAVSVVVLGLLAVCGSAVVSESASGALLGVSIAILLGKFVLYPAIARRHYQKYNAIQEPIRIELKDEGVELSNVDGGGVIRWEKTHKWRQNERYVLIYPMPRLYYIIAKSIRESGFDLRALIKALEMSVGKEA